MGSPRRRSLGGYVVFAVLVFALLYSVRAYLRRSQAPPPGSIPTTVGDTVQKTYNELRASFRDRVPLAEFAGMFHRMADPDSNGELPEIHLASVSDSAGAELPVARFRVEYASARTKAEYLFARIDGIWQLQSFTRVPTELLTVEGKGSGAPAGGGPDTSQKQDAGTQGKKPAEGGGEGAVGRPTLPCDYVIQPGDTLGGLSLRFYGTTRYWRRILDANPGLSERSLRVGRRIRIPSSPQPVAPREDAEPEPKHTSAAP